MNMKDYLIKAYAFDGTVRIYTAVTTNLVAHAQEIHDLWPTSAAALGRLLTVSVIMGAMYAENQELTIRVEGDGPIGSMVSTTNNKGEVQITDGILYAFSKQGQIINLFGSDDGTIADLSYLREQKVNDSGFKSPTDLLFVGHRGGQSYDDRKVSDVTFSWGSAEGGMVNTDLDGNYSQITGEKKSLLVKTQKLFNSKGMLNVVTRKGDMNKKSTQIQTANGKGFSKGNAVMTAAMFDLENGVYKGEENKTAEETYCRSWTTLNRYDRVSRLVRSGADSISDGINEVGKNINGVYGRGQVPYRETNGGSINSILDKLGYLKIGI